MGPVVGTAARPGRAAFQTDLLELIDTLVGRHTPQWCHPMVAIRYMLHDVISISGGVEDYSQPHGKLKTCLRKYIKGS